jgi:hypothetical protein
MWKFALLRRLVVLQFLGVYGSVAADFPAAPTGKWVLNLGQHTLLVLSLSSPSGSGQSISGSLSRPRGFQTSDGRIFSHIQGGVKTEPIVASSWKGGVLTITVRDPADPSDEDTLLFTLKDQTHAQLQLDGVAIPPFDLVLAKGTPSVATDWDDLKTYSPDDGAQSNPGMKRIYDEDQRVRQPGARIDWSSVGKSDGERRETTRELLSEGALHTGEDFTWAAFVFQHGSTPGDYLLAHTLAMIAVKKGYGPALWIATATLDRYLQSIHQPQVYGTQFLNPQGQPATQEPYDRNLISDALRRELGVPVQSAQEGQRKRYEAERVSGK